MKKLLLWIVLTILALLPLSTYAFSFSDLNPFKKEVIISITVIPDNSQNTAKNAGNFSKQDILILINKYAEIYHVSSSTMEQIIRDESQFNVTARGDKYITCQRTGLPVNARGLVQITECYWPEITDKQADDPEFAIEFLANHLAHDRCYYWSTCVE